MFSFSPSCSAHVSAPAGTAAGAGLGWEGRRGEDFRREGVVMSDSIFHPVVRVLLTYEGTAGATWDLILEI